MADSDSFIQEVQEEVRKDQMYRLWRRFGPFIIGGIAAAVIGAAAWGWWENKQIEAARERGGAFIAAQAVEDSAAQATAFAKISEQGGDGVAQLARLRQAAALAVAGQPDAAQEIYLSLAKDGTADAQLRDLAALRAVMQRADTMPVDDMLGLLAPLTAEGNAWRAVALELEAAAYLRQGDADAAIASLTAMRREPNATAGARQRAELAISALGGATEDNE